MAALRHKVGPLLRPCRSVRGQFAAVAPHLSTRGLDLPLHLTDIPTPLQELALPTAAPIELAKCLHPAFYTDDSYTEAERKNIFGKNWFAAAHTAELRNPGDVKVIEVAGSSIVLTCDKKRKIHAFYNVCRHRGARVCQTSTKDCKQLVCPYHWWAYRLDGTLKATPPAFTPKERKENLGLRPVPGVATFQGMVFLNQLPNPPPLLDCLGDLPQKLDRYDLGDMELHATKDYSIAGDWKLVAENFVDFYHINAVHPELAKFSKVDDHTPYQGNGQYVGFVTSPLSDCGGPGDSYHFNRFERLSNVEASAGLFFQIFPNVSVSIYPHSMFTLIALPTAQNGHTKEQLSLLMAPGAQKKGDCDDLYAEKCGKLMDFVVNINNEDVEAIENLQQGLSNACEQGIHGEFLPKYDWPIHRFQNMVLNGLAGSPVNPSIMPELDDQFEQKVQRMS